MGGEKSNWHWLNLSVILIINKIKPKTKLTPLFPSCVLFSNICQPSSDILASSLHTRSCQSGTAMESHNFLMWLFIILWCGFFIMSRGYFIHRKNNRFPFLNILGYLKKLYTHKNPKFGRVRLVPIRELGWEIPGWDLSHFAKFGNFMGIL